MKTVQAVYENGVFRPTTPVELPESCQVEITFRSADPGPASEPSNRRPLSRLAEIANESPENPSLPSDLAAQHDHYLYGLPKHQ
ncbi:MAG: antitoxin family protein [Planctomycetota bacterium]|nr:antitoxin family protein [Planctomycetota bacterium]